MPIEAYKLGECYQFTARSAQTQRGEMMRKILILSMAVLTVFSAQAELRVFGNTASSELPAEPTGDAILSALIDPRAPDANVGSTSVYYMDQDLVNLSHYNRPNNRGELAVHRFNQQARNHELWRKTIIFSPNHGEN